MKILSAIARYAVAALFIFSGLIKINDPVGTAIKLEEYFDVFASDFAPFFEWFIPAALVLSVVLSVLEVVLGVALIIGFRMRLTAWALLLLIVFFTFLTFYSAYFNKVTDCGCFGDAIKLTPWESFTKDIILLGLIGIIFIRKDTYQEFFSANFRLLKVVGATVFFTGVAIYAIAHLPFIDFRAYKIGNHLPTLMQPSEEYRYEYVMKKNGEEVRLDYYPSDKSYEFMAMNILNPEAQPKITDLGVWNDDGDFTEDLMTGTKLLIVIQNAEKVSAKNMAAISLLAKQFSIGQTWILTSSGYEAIENLRHEHQLAAPFYYADATVLKTMIRSNPGILLLREGTVLGKWHHNDTPELPELHAALQ